MTFISYWYKEVAPLVGAWIEMLNGSAELTSKHVAPLVGAWIEIFSFILMLIECASLLL